MTVERPSVFLTLVRRSVIPIGCRMSDPPADPKPEPFTVSTLLQTTPALAKERAPALAAAAAKIFDYAQYLLDDDEKLTRTGALNAEARELLRKRILELTADTDLEPADDKTEGG
jgi:hypothetical protein